MTKAWRRGESRGPGAGISDVLKSVALVCARFLVIGVWRHPAAPARPSFRAGAPYTAESHANHHY